MKKGKIKFLILIVTIMFISSGCTEFIKDGKQNVIYEETGQTLTKNILCKPEDESIVELYKQHESKMDIKLSELPSCSEFKPSDIKYNGLWEAAFVKPLAWLILNIGNVVSNMGLAVMLVGLLIRVVLIPLSKKSTLQSENMKKAKPEIAKIEKKYESLTKNAPENKLSEITMAKSQETMMVYKKYGINPVSGCIVAFIQLPIFFAFLEAINRVPAIFEDSLLGMRLGMTPLKGITEGQYIYIVLLLLIIGSTYFSMKNAMAQGAGEAEKQMAFMSKFMMIFIAIASLNLPTAIALYWTTTNVFQIVQNYIIKKLVAEKVEEEVEKKPKTTKSPKHLDKNVKSAKISKKRGN